VNQKNLLVHPDSRGTLIDCDSFQVQDPASGALHPCGVGVLDWQPPEMHGADWATAVRTRHQDAFGLAVLLFHLLMEGFHPFQCVRPAGDASSGALADNVNDPRPTRCRGCGRGL
jgi:DNA-binding helix-hairpin-helix protein with protein kinase domain